MNKFIVVMKHSFLTKFRSRPFQITTVILVLAALALTNQNRISSLFDQGPTEIGVIAPVEISKQLEQSVSHDDFKLTSFSDMTEAKKAIIDNKIEGILEITRDQGTLGATLQTTSNSNESMNEKLTIALQQIKNAELLKSLSVSEATLQQINSKVGFETIVITSKNGKIEVDTTAKSTDELAHSRGIVYILLMVQYMLGLLYANMIATEVASEKSTRVMEILVSSINPISHMFARILGILLLAVTQIGLVGIVIAFSIKNKKDGSNDTLSGFLDLSHVPVSTLIYAIVFLILGYLLFATIASFLGALVSRVEDAQQILWPMTMTLVASFIIAMSGLGDPNTPIISIMSFIPFFSPIIMFLRVSMLDIPFWQVGVCLLELLLTIGIFAWLGSRIYKGGVLMYGKSSSFKDLKKAFSMSKNS